MARLKLGPEAQNAGYRLLELDAVGSTNSAAMRAAREGDGGGLWVATLHQTEGRGRRGRAWRSEPGNLAASLLMTLPAGATRAPTLGFVAGVALARALETLMPELATRVALDGADGAAAGRPARVVLKWPNDVIADGAKLAGILLEAEAVGEGRLAVVAGFGVNVVSAPAGLPYPATSLLALGAGHDAAAVLAALAEAWVGAHAVWNGGQGVAEIMSEWRTRATGIGAPVAVDWHGETVRGVFKTVDAEGRLIIGRPGDADLAVTAGDVHFGVTARAAP